MSQYREIITKAVVAKGRKFTKSSHTICPAHHPSSILGCWIINHKYEAIKVGKKVEIHGSYEINVWYSYNHNTKTEVVTERVQYTDVISIRYRDPDCFDDQDIIAKAVQQPNCLEAIISPDGQNILVRVEREFFVEVDWRNKNLCRCKPNGRCEDEWDVDSDDDDEFEDLDPDFLDEFEDE